MSDLRIAYNDRKFNLRSLFMIDNTKIDRILCTATRKTWTVELAIGAVSDRWWKAIRRIGFVNQPAGRANFREDEDAQEIVASDCNGPCPVL